MAIRIAIGRMYPDMTFTGLVNDRDLPESYKKHFGITGNEENEIELEVEGQFNEERVFKVSMYHEDKVIHYIDAHIDQDYVSREIECFLYGGHPWLLKRS